ncbi:MAG TPA: cofactor-independent phosphoglycerate mutase [Planctomycetes bacterium]|nr:cofactor-independent phosphoglycerate mutase [Planctomycetota bacterium]
MTTKYAIIIPDGAADYPLDCYDGRTILQVADIPNTDKISIEGKQGIVQTVPPDMPPGSDVAQMSLLGYDPVQYYPGRAPIEAVAKGIKLAPGEWIFRCNLVTIADGKMADHSAGHISTEEAEKLIRELQDALGDAKIRFHPGVSYRNLCVIADLDFDVETQPPHDIIGQRVSKYLPHGKNADFLNDIMARSQQLFENHEINRVRRDLGENPVSSVWLWGQGQAAHLESFHKRFGLKGAAITAVDLVRGLARLIGFDVIDVPGATGYFDTNYAGKAQAAIKALRDHDLVFVHIEAPDEAGHSGNAELKKKAVEMIDKQIVGPLYEALQKYQSWRILVIPDHPTPVETQAHTDDPVPFAMSGTGVKGILHKPFSEENAYQSGFRVDNGFEMMEYFLKA